MLVYVTSIFTFSLNVFKTAPSQGCYNLGLCGKRLNIIQKLELVAENIVVKGNKSGKLLQTTPVLLQVVTTREISKP